jgi:hypothetical protein
MARTRRLAAAGAVTAFVIGGVSLPAGIGAAAAQSSPEVPGAVPTCLLPLPLLCDDAPTPDGPTPGDTWSSAPHDPRPEAPAPQDTWPGGKGAEVSENPWRPAGEDQHRVPKGHPETGGGGLAQDGPVWPFTLGGTALLTGAALAGIAVKRRRAAAEPPHAVRS